jgi:hypothetical protein
MLCWDYVCLCSWRWLPLCRHSDNLAMPRPQATTPIPARWGDLSPTIQRARAAVRQKCPRLLGSATSLGFFICRQPAWCETIRDSPKKLLLEGRAIKLASDPRPRTIYPGWNATSPFVGPIAQWLEQATHNRLVTGSNPVGPTIQEHFGNQGCHGISQRKSRND